MALYNNPYQYSFGVPGQMNQFQQQPVQIPAQPVQQPQQNNSGILWVSGEVGAKSYLVAPGTSVLLMDSESEKFFIKSTDVSGMPQPLRTFEYHEVGSQMPPKQPVPNMDSKYVTRQECARIEDELSKIADNGLTTGNLEMTYKLIDMYKDIKNTQYWDKKAEYYNAVLDEMRGGYNDDYSERGRKRDSMGRYSSNDGRMMPDYDRGSSYARRGEHYVRGHYSRSDGRDAYDDYMTQKQSYRSGKSEDCKRKMLAALEEHLDELTTEMSDMSKDAECREERDLVKRYVEKLRDML